MHWSIKPGNFTKKHKIDPNILFYLVFFTTNTHPYQPRSCKFGKVPENSNNISRNRSHVTATHKKLSDFYNVATY